MLNIILVALGRRKSVSSILSSFSKQAAQLRKLTDEATAEGAKLNDKAASMRLAANSVAAEADERSAEAERAAEMANRIERFIA
ncbi:hypothetical protein MHM88_11210 [Epibacterium sp. MM17-32]|uniref:hypothetical protein n=1 Tax=Epibacterium sp. MM17-32 TaxID=2917734 RepID=UPI001EF46BD9|nr:hypothetical protein [Epibacterium sp. MM17-32]MCG7628376.1 hypothetical protein [Epibacterium sp. MM17-32]